MLDRVHQIGEGAALISKRSEVTLALEERMENQREAQWVAMSLWQEFAEKGAHLFLKKYIY